MAVLLVAAAAAASVSAATSSHKSTQASNGKQLGPKKNAVKFVGTGHFASTQGHSPGFINAHAPANANAIKQHDRGIPGKGVKKGAPPSGQVGASTPAPPHGHSLPITTGH